MWLKGQVVICTVTSDSIKPLLLLISEEFFATKVLHRRKTTNCKQELCQKSPFKMIYEKASLELHSLMPEVWYRSEVQNSTWVGYRVNKSNNLRQRFLWRQQLKCPEICRTIVSKKLRVGIQSKLLKVSQLTVCSHKSMCLALTVSFYLTIHRNASVLLPCLNKTLQCKIILVEG